jgi:hypothetical protein
VSAFTGKIPERERELIGGIDSEAKDFHSLVGLFYKLAGRGQKHCAISLCPRYAPRTFLASRSAFEPAFHRHGRCGSFTSGVRGFSAALRSN